MLLDIVEIISSKFDNNINHLTVSTIGGIFRAIINVAVSNAEEVKNICNTLASINGIEQVNRIYHE